MLFSRHARRYTAPPMLFVLSPAKTLDASPAPGVTPTKPQFGRDTTELAKVAKTLKPGDLKALMGISDDLAALNRERFRAFKLRGTGHDLPAALTFAGDVYTGLRARELDAPALEWAQGRVRILSGLYGLLRPLDAIQPYRLEMGVRLATDRGATLYDFWGELPAKALNAAARGQKDKAVVNLASQEYWGAVDRAALRLPVLTCLFKQETAGGLTQTAFYAKKARGLMTRWAIDRRAERRVDLKNFDSEGYRFNAGASTTDTYVFSRPHP